MVYGRCVMFPVPLHSGHFRFLEEPKGQSGPGSMPGASRVSLPLPPHRGQTRGPGVILMSAPLGGSPSCLSRQTARAFSSAVSGESASPDHQASWTGVYSCPSPTSSRPISW
jgi:hypothetical protein